MATYKTLGMLRNGGMQKDVNDLVAGAPGVPYLLASQRLLYLVEVSPNKRLTEGGFLLNTSAGHLGKFIFVMDGEGRIYTANKATVHHHSSFLAGGPAAAAGHWQVQYGALVALNNQSGHYQPPFDYTQQILVELKRRGMDVSGAKADWTGAASAKTAKVAEARDIVFERIGPKGVIKARF